MVIFHSSNPDISDILEPRDRNFAPQKHIPNIPDSNHQANQLMWSFVDEKLLVKSEKMTV